MPKILKAIQFVFAALSSFVAAVLIIALLPIEGNYKLLIVQSGSMEPSIPLASLVMVHPKPEYAVGDVVTYKTSQKESSPLVTHRINSFAGDTFGMVFQTKGDANKTPDPEKVAWENILGKVILVVPGIGLLFHKIKTPLGFILVVIVPATIVIYEELKSVWQTIRHGTAKYFNKKKPTKLSSDDELLLKDIEKLKKQNWQVDHRIMVGFLFFGISFVFAGVTQGFFSDIESASAILATNTANGSPSPSSSPGVSPSPQPAHIVINEVYYDVDASHGLDSPGDRGVTVGGHCTQLRKKNSSRDNSFVDLETLCSVIQINQTEADVDINALGSSGKNQSSVNNGANINSGDVANAIVVDITGGSNTLFDFCGKGLSRNHEWIELYNPTSQTVNLKDWTIVDNSGISVRIPGNRNLGSGEFALISKSNSTWAFWNEPSGTLKIPLGRQIGDGLDNAGDHLILKNSADAIIDAMSYGDDSSEFNLPGVVEGHSLERNPDGLDTNTAPDWVDRSLPQPGT